MTSSPLRRAAIRLSYIYPLLLISAFTVLSIVPHIFFVYGATVQDTLSLFSLMGNGVSISWQMLTGQLEGTTAEAAFSRAVIVYFVVSVLCLVFFWITALLQAVFGSYVFSLQPTSDAANKAKRWFRFLCPNRALLCISHLLLIVPLCFPQMLGYFYHQYLGISAVPHYLGFHDLWVVGALLVVDVLLLFATLPWQDTEHMDLYRLYRKRTDTEKR